MVFPLPVSLYGARVHAVPAPDGVVLALDERGPRDADTIVFAHGFGQTRAAWQNTAVALADVGWRTLSYDARGHGDSSRREDGDYSVEQLIGDLDAVCALSTRAPVVVGASMGGLVGIAWAGRARAHCRALVLVDITPRWEAAGVARIIHFMRAHPLGFASLQEASDAIASYLPHRRERKSPERLRTLLVPSPDGRLRWHWDPRMLTPIAEHANRHQSDLSDAARRLRVPTLLISGAQSDVVSDATINEFLELVPHATHARVASATHMLAGDENTAFTRHVRAFLDDLPTMDTTLQD
ncbi:MAG: alpha/beta fold hydrolase [Dokdonella sp.]